jgi:hypothetical protein
VVPATQEAEDRGLFEPSILRPAWPTHQDPLLKHKETPCVTIINKQKLLFFSFTKSENRRAEQVLSGGVGTSGKQ